MNSFKSILVLIIFLLLGLASIAQTADNLPIQEEIISLSVAKETPKTLTVKFPTVESIEKKSNGHNVQEEIAFLFNYKQLMKPVLRKTALC